MCKVYWCDIQPFLSHPAAFIHWCGIHQIPWADYLSIRDATRHFAGRQLCRFAQKNDAPRFTSVSHSGRLVLCAGSHHPVGIDVERLGAAPAVPAEFFTDEERAWMASAPDPAHAFFRLWTRKESLIKARRSVLADIPLLPSLVQRGGLKRRIGTLEIRELTGLPTQYCVSVCFEGEGQPELFSLPDDQIFSL